MLGAHEEDLSSVCRRAGSQDSGEIKMKQRQSIHSIQKKSLAFCDGRTVNQMTFGFLLTKEAGGGEERGYHYSAATHSPGSFYFNGSTINKEMKNSVPKEAIAPQRKPSFVNGCIEFPYEATRPY